MGEDRSLTIKRSSNSQFPSRESYVSDKVNHWLYAFFQEQCWSHPIPIFISTWDYGTSNSSQKAESQGFNIINITLAVPSCAPFGRSIS